MSRKPKSNQFRPALVDIVIPVLNRFDLLEKCLNAIPKAVNGAFDYNIVLVDNASKREDANAFYDKLDRNILVIRNQTNTGFPHACNQGAKRRNSPLLFFLNSDVLLWEDSLKYAVQAMDDPKVGLCGMKLLFPEDLGDLPVPANTHPRGKVQHVGIAMSIRTEPFHIFLGWDADHPKVNAVRDAYMVTGAAFLTRRNLWNKIGGFYEGYGIGCYEDCDYSLSIRELGFNIIVETKAVGYHYTGASAISNQVGYPIMQNRLVFLQRWQNKLKWSELESW